MGNLFGKSSPPPPQIEYRTDPALARSIELLTAQLADQKREYDRIARAMEERKIESFDDLQAQDAKMAAELLKLARNTPATHIDGWNIGFFGNTSVGKSSLLNALHGSPVAATGAGEVTTVIKKYPSVGLNLWDVPGKNDITNYYTLPYVSCIKGLSQRVVMVSSTVKEMSKMIGMFRELGLSFTIVVNKCDLLDDDELEPLKQKILAEVAHFCPGAGTFFVAAKKPTLLPHAEELRRLTLALAPPVAPGGAAPGGPAAGSPAAGSPAAGDAAPSPATASSSSAEGTTDDNMHTK